jgi:ABC-type transport system substrate-binding protein
MINRNKEVILAMICIGIISSGVFCVLPLKTDSATTHFFTITATASTPEMLEYLNLLKLYLSRIGVNLDIVLYDCGNMWMPIFAGQFDMACIEFFNVDNLGFYINKLYSENASYNFFGYQSYMDFKESLGMGKNEWYLNQLNSYFLPDRQVNYNLCWEWQTYLLDQLLPCIPLFNEKEYLLIYDNLDGMDYVKGLIQSWGNLQWNGFHPGQLFNNELIIADNEWIDLNPAIKKNNNADTFIENCIFDTLVKKDADQTYWPHLAEIWLYHDINHVNFTIREGIRWQEDQDGLFTTEYLDINDVYFSLYVYDMLHNLTWIDSYTILDDQTIDLELNLDLIDYRNVSFNYLDELSEIKILPEFYLNQTQLVDGVTPDITHSSWQKFSKYPFGTGLMQMKYYLEDVETMLSIFKEGWWLNEIITYDIGLNWDERYGNFQDTLENLRIRILDENERIYEFNLGRIDIFPRTFDEYLDFEASQNNSTVMKVLSKPSNRFMALIFNLCETRGYIGNLDPSPLMPAHTIGWSIRKAIAYSIDREEINDVLYGGRMDVNNWPISPTLDLWCNPEIGNYCYNIDWARAFMTTAGFDVCGGYDNEYNPNTEGWPDWDKGCVPQGNITLQINTNYSIALVTIISMLFIFKKKRKQKRIVK